MLATPVGLNKRRSSARRRVELRYRGYNAWGRHDATLIPPSVIYNMPYINITESIQQTAEARQRAATVFQEVQTSRLFKSSKLADKKFFFCQYLYPALWWAWHNHGCVAYERHPRSTPKMYLQVIEAAAELELIYNVVSPPGSPRMSRLLALPLLEQTFSADPWQHHAERLPRFVFLQERDSKKDILFELNDPFAAHVQQCLERINATNGQFEITYHPYDEWADRNIGVRRLRPVHYARFIDGWHHHGRLYTGKYGHQSLRSNERQWIYFDGQPSVELDYSGLHARMLYHLEGIDYQDDPYQLVGDKTTPELRHMAKIVLNAAINAACRRAAISACNQALNPRTAEGQLKTGKAAHRASLLQRAAEETGVTFSDLYDLALKRHEPIAQHFGTDAGLRLMNLDGRLALNILYHFANKGVPCLGVHDSFIVPTAHGPELKEVMHRFYQQELGFSPAVQ